MVRVYGSLGVGKFPSTALDVNGTITATNFAGNGSGLTHVNAAAVSNGVYTNGNYADPSWITSLSGSKITGAVAAATTAASTAQIGTNRTNYVPRWNGTQLVYGIITDDGSAAAAVNGTLTVASLVSVSDERYKRNIQPIQLSLEKVMQLAGVSYEWKIEEYGSKGFTEGRQIGLIAQDVEKVLPELVRTDEKGYKAVAYDKLMPVLVEAVKEQQSLISEKDARIEKLEKAIEMMEKRLRSLETPARTVALK
jgi:hypothetical protein